MENLHLFSSYPSSGAPDEEQPRNCADGTPRFILIPAPRLPAWRLVQGLGAEMRRSPGRAILSLGTRPNRRSKIAGRTGHTA